MKITFTKRFEYKDKSGTSTYPAGATLPVSDKVAIAAVIKGATDTPKAVDLAKQSDAVISANKTLSKMTKPELLEYIKDTNSDNAAVEIIAAQKQLETCQAKLEGLEDSKDDLSTDLATAKDKITELETALDAAEQRAVQAEKGEQAFRDLLKEAGISEADIKTGLKGK